MEVDFIEFKKTSERHPARQILIQISGTLVSPVQTRVELNLPSKSASIVSVVEEYRYKRRCVVVVVVLLLLCFVLAAVYIINLKFTLLPLLLRTRIHS